MTTKPVPQLCYAVANFARTQDPKTDRTDDEKAQKVRALIRQHYPDLSDAMTKQLIMLDTDLGPAGALRFLVRCDVGGQCVYLVGTAMSKKRSYREPHHTTKKRAVSFQGDGEERVVSVTPDSPVTVRTVHHDSDSDDGQMMRSFDEMGHNGDFDCNADEDELFYWIVTPKGLDVGRALCALRVEAQRKYKIKIFDDPSPAFPLDDAGH